MKYTRNGVILPDDLMDYPNVGGMALYWSPKIYSLDNTITSENSKYKYSLGIGFNQNQDKPFIDFHKIYSITTQ